MQVHLFFTNIDKVRLFKIFSLKY